ncbi:MAG: hypothetical protein V3W18_09430 [candidate division Zixibacteria bacterium]
MISERMVKFYRIFYILSIIAIVCGLFVLGIVVLVSNSINSMSDIFNALIFIPLNIGFPFFMIIILLSIVGIIINIKRWKEYSLVIITCISLLVFLFLYTILFGFLNIGGFYYG